MLVLTRKSRQKVKIRVSNVMLAGEACIEIEVLVCEAKTNQVKLGFTAPPNVSIWREEIENARAEEGKEQR